MHDQAGIGRGLWFGRHTSTVMCALTSCYPTRITNTLNHDLGGDDVLGASGKLGRGIPFTTIWATLFIVRGDEQADDLAVGSFIRMYVVGCLLKRMSVNRRSSLHGLPHIAGLVWPYCALTTCMHLLVPTEWGCVRYSFRAGAACA